MENKQATSHAAQSNPKPISHTGTAQHYLQYSLAAYYSASHHGFMDEAEMLLSSRDNELAWAPGHIATTVPMSRRCTQVCCGNTNVKNLFWVDPYTHSTVRTFIVF
jgi:hypothetical protein